MVSEMLVDHGGEHTRAKQFTSCGQEAEGAYRKGSGQGHIPGDLLFLLAPVPCSLVLSNNATILGTAKDCCIDQARSL